MKRVIGTRWSAHYKAVKSLKESLSGILAALDELSSLDENMNTRGDALSLHKAVLTFSFVAHLHFWEDVLCEVDDSQT